jgi:glycosyltransferase involved in cell wall biosynthesis
MKLLLSSNTEWYLYNFRRALGVFLRERGWDVVMVSPPGPYAEKLQEMGFRWVQWDLGRKTLTPWKEFAALRQITEIYQREKPDVVHHNTIKPVIYGSFAARRVGVKGIINAITGRGYVFLGNDAKARVLGPLAQALYRLAFRPANSVTIFENVTDQDYFVMNGLIPSSRTRVIESSGVDPIQFTPQPEPEGIPIILMASRMLWDKGVGVLVEAAKLLKGRIPIRIALAGDPDPGNPASIPAETLRQWDTEGIIEWWGFQADMNATYGKCHIATLPSHYAEGLPISLLEAAACERPIVTTTIPGCQDFVTDEYNGLLVSPNDPVALASALEKLAVDPALRRQMGVAGRRRVLEKYTNELVNSATLAVYRELLPL